MPAPDTPARSELAGRVAVVTGAAGDVGAAVARRLLDAGVRLAAADRPGPDLDTTVRHLIAAGAGEVFAAPVQASVAAEVQAMAERVERHFGRIDILVHAAGAPSPADAEPRPLHRLGPGEFSRAVDATLKSAFLCNRAVLKTMTAARYGQIVNLSAALTLPGPGFDPVRAASGFGVIGLTEALAQEVRASGVRVVALQPDAVRTPLWDCTGPRRARPAPLPPERIAALVEFMLRLPMDAVLNNVILSPFRAGRRRS
ncbi:MAG: SDR family oxidoreductase [Lentisphaerae bacterium]|nr:SDR family oxidoreductase [Lentisphaerota bacterium]